MNVGKKKTPAQMRKYKREWAAKDRKENPERNLAAAKKYRESHRKECNELAKIYYQNHPKYQKRQLKRLKVWMKNNQDKVKAARRRYNKDNKKRNNQLKYNWVKRNPEKRRIINSMYITKRKRAMGNGLVTVNDWMNILKKHNHKCAYCGCSNKKLTADHVIPLSRGGTHTPSNIVPACQSCNSSKSSFLLKEWESKKIA